MKRNKILLVILILLILITIGVVIFYLKNSNEEKKIDNSFIDDAQIDYYNEESSYYNYYDKGTISLNINEFVKMPENYLEYEISGNNEEELNDKLSQIMYSIVEKAEVKIPNKLLNGHYGDLYSNIKTAADNEEQTIDEYVETLYETDNYKEFAEKNQEIYEEQIKKDMVYQALANEFSIKVEQSDIEDYFSAKIEEGYTYEDLKDMYGEELLYKYTLQDKVEKELLKRFSK